ncbi:MAG: hypothetical protein ACKO4U_01190 [Caldilinea sp.]
MGVAGHVKHCSKVYFPGILFWRPLPDEDGNPEVDGLGELGITSAAKGWTGASVWVEESDFLWGQGEASLCVLQVFDCVCKEDKFCGWLDVVLVTPEGEQAEFETAVNTRENCSPVFEIVETDQASCIKQMLEKILIKRISGNTCGCDDSRSTICGK